MRKRVTESKKSQVSKKGIQNNAQDEGKHKEIRSGKGLEEKISVEVSKNEEELELWDEQVCEEVEALGLLQDQAVTGEVEDVGDGVEQPDDDDQSHREEAVSEHVVPELVIEDSESEVAEAEEEDGAAESVPEVDGVVEDAEDVVSEPEADIEDDALSDSERTVSVRTSNRERRPAVKVTYDVLGTPTLAGVKSSLTDPGVLTADDDHGSAVLLGTPRVLSTLNPLVDSFVPGAP